MFFVVASPLYVFCGTDLYQLVLWRQKLGGHLDENTWDLYHLGCTPDMQFNHIYHHTGKFSKHILDKER